MWPQAQEGAAKIASRPATPAFRAELPVLVMGVEDAPHALVGHHHTHMDFTGPTPSPQARLSHGMSISR